MGVLSLELNELNFHYVKLYASRGRLPTMARLINEGRLAETDAGECYPALEPWIQWPTVYTGRRFEEHGLFRLGDAADREQVQIWDYLEGRGLKVGAISPMNASNRCRNPAFFLPDPWTHTEIVAEPGVVKLFELVRQLVNDNASTRDSVAGLARQVLPLALPYINVRSAAEYVRMLPSACKYKWGRAAFLDRLLADLFISLWRKHRPDFASLFLNAGAHIQHHHTYDSAAYSGERANPDWYSKAAATGADPLLFIYQLYDNIIADCLAVSDARVIITTGLSQVPNSREHYQYRIVNFGEFFTRVGLVDVDILPRMSRDFLLEFDSEGATVGALSLLNTVRVGQQPLFMIEQRGRSLFCQVAYFGPPEGLTDVTIAGEAGDYSDSFVLVSIENAIHQSTGYIIDTASEHSVRSEAIPLESVFGRLCDASLAKSNANGKSLRAA